MVRNHIYDYRTHGKDFGAEIDLEWDNNISKFDNNLYNLENVFGIDKLPIFQELGEIKLQKILIIFLQSMGFQLDLYL